MTEQTSPTRIGNSYRESSAPADILVINNLPGKYEAEDWRACYWSVNAAGELDEHAVTLQLPVRYSTACKPIRPGEPGCILRVRRWGVGCHLSLLELAGFDPVEVAGPEASDDELMAICFATTHFDLPGGFIIADPDYPLLMFDPEGILKGYCVTGDSHLGALAFIASGGQVTSDFQLTLRESPGMYRDGIQDLQALLRKWLDE